MKPVLEYMKRKEIPIYIYSSGSIEAQQLLFENSVDGNLLDLFNGYFDTLSGGKCESESYITISAKIGFDPSDILFLSDNYKGK